MDTLVEPPKVLACAATGVEDFIRANNGDVDAIFGAAGVRTDDLTNPFNELNLTQFCALFEESSQRTGNDNFGLRFGAQFKPKQLGAIGYAAISSPTLAAGLRNMEKYFPAHQGQSSFGLLQDSDVLWLSYRIFDSRITARRQDAELSMGMFLNVFRNALGNDWSPLELRFEHDRPDGASEHETVFNAPVQFGRRTNALAFRRSELDATMPDSDPYLFSLIEPFLKSRCQLKANPEDFATLVRNEIKLHLGEVNPSIAEIARFFGVTDHAFQRQLKAHKVSFHDLLRAARQELALHYMNDAQIPLTEVASSLGYSELSAFSRAFRKWTGMSPQRFRRARLGDVKKRDH